jgi:hypothetical protein
VNRQQVVEDALKVVVWQFLWLNVIHFGKLKPKLNAVHSNWAHQEKASGKGLLLNQP